MESAPEELMNQSESHPVLSLVTAVFWVLLWLLSWAKSVIAFATISIPRFIYAVLSYSLTFTLNFWSFVIIFVLSAVAIHYWIRSRYLNIYTTLKEPPLVKTDAKELHPDVNTTEAPPSFHNYLDDFLQAVRIFGFLEKPVFHELARHLQTRRLIAGDSLSLDQDKNFYCVIDGLVQVYSRTGDAQHGVDWDEDNTNGYQLLNEVGSGGTLSSLFTILSLFTEDVRMSWQETDTEGPGQDTNQHVPLPQRTRIRRSDSDVSTIELEQHARSSSASSRSRSRRRSVSSSGSTVHGDHATLSSPIDRRSRIASGEGNSSASYAGYENTDRLHRPDYGSVALAVEDATLAVIPAEAFRRLTKKFPKASAHIVQVIMTRFSRVTIHAAHKYLGLTTEVLRTEKAINEIAFHPLPSSFYEGGGLQRLRQRFDRQTGGESPPTEMDYFSPSHSQSPRESPEIAQRVTDDMSFTESPQIYAKSLPKESSRSEGISLSRTHSSRLLVQAGDLHTTTGNNDTYRPLHRSFSMLGSGLKSGTGLLSPLNGIDVQRITIDDFDLRDEVMSCIAKSIGLHQPPLSGSDSVEASPAFSAINGRVNEAHERERTFTSFGSLSLLETGDDVSSVTASSITGTSNGNIAALDNEVEILFFTAGSTLARAGERHPGLFYVIDGILDISLPHEDSSENINHAESTSKAGKPSSSVSPSLSEASDAERYASKKTTKKASRHLFTVKPGGIAGYMASLCGIPSYVDITAKMDTYVGFLPYNALERLLEKRPIVLLTLAKRLISLLSPLVLHIDASLDWMQVSGGKILWRPGDASDSFYIVINGRLRAIDDKEEGQVRILAEYGQGDSVGELDVITRSPRRNTVHAIRDTELVRMPLTLFNAISSRNPQATAQLLRLIAARVRDEVDSSSSGRSNTAPDLGLNSLSFKTVAIMPVSRNLPIEAFSKKLQVALESIGAPTAYLNQASISRHLGRHAFTRMGKLKVAGWLADQEQRYRTVLYIVDSPVNSTWTQTCIRQADCVMIVGAGEDPSLGEYERLLMSVKTTARKELVLLHPERSVFPGSTREWLKIRPWISRHFHVELPGIVIPVPKASLKDPDPAAVAVLKNFKDKVQSEIQKYRGGRDTPRPQRPPHMNDFARLARRICGKSIGVVLGGGGARGIAHLGVLQALTEYGIPIDHVGGTSIGAFIGGLYAREGDTLSSAGRAKHFSSRMGNYWRLFSDLTYPLVAYTTGHEFNRAIYKAFYNLHIEDMWLPFFCNTTNILTSQMEIHDSGYAWRYIRASMTLVGLLPPLCDNGNMLVDGGYMDILPVSSMLAIGASAVFASDVASVDDNSPRNFGDTVSGIWLLINRWNPFSNARQIPPITEIQSRLAYVSSVKTLEQAKVARNCFYMQMPVQEYTTLQFSKHDDMKSKGHHAAMDMLEKWEEEVTEEESTRTETEDESIVDTSLLKDLGKNSLVNALNSVNGAKTLVLDPSISGPLGLLTEVSLLKHHGVDKMFWLEPGPLSPTTTNVVYLTSPKIKWIKIISDQIKRHIQDGQKHTYTIFLVPRKSALVTRVLEEEGVLGEVSVSSFNMQFIPIAPDVISLEHENAFKEIWVDGDETIVYDSAQALITLQKLYGLFPRIVGKGDCAGRLAGLLSRQLEQARQSSTANNLVTLSDKFDSLIILDRRVDMITPMMTQLTYEGLIDEFMGIKNSSVEVPASLLATTTANPKAPAGSSSTAPSLSVTSIQKEAKKKYLLNPTTDPLLSELMDLNFSAVGKTLNKTARRLDEDYKRRHQAETVAQLKDFVGRLGGLQNEHQSLRLHTGLSEILVPLTRTDLFNKALEIQQNLLSSYEISTQIAAIEDLVAQGAGMQIVVRLLCLASIINGGIKTKALESLKREILQSYGYQYLPLILSLSSPPLGLLVPNPLPSTATSLAAMKIPYTSLRKSLRLMKEEPDDQDEPEDISYVYSGYAPMSVRLVQCVIQKGGILNPVDGNEAAKKKGKERQGIESSKVRAHPIVGWKGFEDIVNSLPGETIDLSQTGGRSSNASLLASSAAMYSIEKTTTSVVFFLGGCTYTEIAALRWVARQSKGRRILVATTGIVSGTSLINSVAGGLQPDPAAKEAGSS